MVLSWFYRLKQYHCSLFFYVFSYFLRRAGLSARLIGLVKGLGRETGRVIASGNGSLGQMGLGIDGGVTTITTPMVGDIPIIVMDGMVTNSLPITITGLPIPQHLLLTAIHRILIMENGIQAIGPPMRPLIRPFAIPAITADHLKTRAPTYPEIKHVGCSLGLNFSG